MLSNVEINTKMFEKFFANLKTKLNEEIAPELASITEREVAITSNERFAGFDGGYVFGLGFPFKWPSAGKRFLLQVKVGPDGLQRCEVYIDSVTSENLVCFSPSLSGVIVKFVQQHSGMTVQDERFSSAISELKAVEARLF